ncbi:MAG TPA: hypothetical protein VNL15_03145 [Dehalococcoidia bacterium]|nr:hypothetical protein [Dehalococcoidia bacterium]
MLSLAQAGAAVYLVWLLSHSQVIIPPAAEDHYFWYLGPGVNGRDLAKAALALAGGMLALAGLLLQRRAPLGARLLLFAGGVLGLPLSLWAWQFAILGPTFVPSFLMAIALFSPFKKPLVSYRVYSTGKPDERLVLDEES